MMQANFTPEEVRIATEIMAVKAVEKALRSLGYRLKLDMSNAISTGRMGWATVKLLTKTLREHFRTVSFAGVWYSRFTRYSVEPKEKHFDLTVGVFNPAKIKQLSSTIVSGAGRLTRGWQTKVTEMTRKKLIRRYLEVKKIDWNTLSSAEKAKVRKDMLKAGVMVKSGSLMVSPARPTTDFLMQVEERSKKEFAELVKMALEGTRWPKQWWIKIEC